MGLNVKKGETSVRIGEVRFSFPHVFEPWAMDEKSEKKYTCSIIIPKENKEALTLVEDAIEAAKKIGAEKYWSGKVPAKLKLPLREGDFDREDDPAYAGCMFLNANNSRKPGVQVLEDGLRYDATDDEDFYAGCYGAVTLNFYPYDKNGNRGIGVSLGNLIKLRDGDRLSAGGESVDDSFSDIG